MPPKRRGSSTRSQSKRAKNSTAASTRGDNVTQSDGQTALATASVEQLRSLSASSLRHHLKANSLSSSGNKAAMANRLYSYLHTSGVTRSADSDDSVVPPQDNRANSDNPAAPPDNRAPSQAGNGGQPDSNVDLTTQLTNFFRQFMPVTGQSETTNPTLRPVAANNNHSTSTATNDGTATNTGQIPTSISQSMLANQALSSENQPLAATDGPLSRASSIQPLTLVTDPITISRTSQPLSTMINQPLAMTSNQGLADSLRQSQTLPPIPAKIKERIIRGEYIDFTTLIPKAMLSSNVEPEHPTSFIVQLPSGSGDFSLHPSAKGRKITSFSSWMEAWNVYLAIRVDHIPSCAPSLIAYQRIITSASVSYPLQSWLNYDVQFRMLAASDPSLRWDTRHPDLWLQCITPSGIQQSKRWPCPYCGATNHFPDRCPFRTNPSKQLSSGQWNHTKGQHNSGVSGSSIVNRHNLPRNSGPGYCRDFNYSSCTRERCKFAHHCEHCNANHPARDCPYAGPIRSTY